MHEKDCVTEFSSGTQSPSVSAGTASDDELCQSLQDNLFSIELQQGEHNSGDTEELEWCTRFREAIEAFTKANSSSDMARVTVLKTLYRLLWNIVKSPDEPRYRRLRDSNPALKAKLLGFNLARQLMESLFIYNSNSKEWIFDSSRDKYASWGCDTLKEYLTEREFDIIRQRRNSIIEEERKRDASFCRSVRGTRKKLDVGSEWQRVLELLECDKKEREAEANFPIRRASCDPKIKKSVSPKRWVHKDGEIMRQMSLGSLNPTDCSLPERLVSSQTRTPPLVSRSRRLSFGGVENYEHVLSNQQPSQICSSRSVQTKFPSSFVTPVTSQQNEISADAFKAQADIAKSTFSNTYTQFRDSSGTNQSFTDQPSLRTSSVTITRHVSTPQFIPAKPLSGTSGRVENIAAFNFLHQSASLAAGGGPLLSHIESKYPSRWKKHSNIVTVQSRQPEFWRSSNYPITNNLSPLSAEGHLSPFAQIHPSRNLPSFTGRGTALTNAGYSCPIARKVNPASRLWAASTVQTFVPDVSNLTVAGRRNSSNTASINSTLRKTPEILLGESK